MPYFTSRSGQPDVSSIAAELWVGSYPEPQDFPWLGRALGVRAVLSLQDDFDLAAKRLTLADLEHAARASHIAFARVAVGDGDHAALAARLSEAVALLAELIQVHGPTYLHCNAGFNRAPTVAIAYLHVHHALSVRDAIQHFQARRSSIPYVSVLQTVYRDCPSLRSRTA